jgi:hypothetical protein
MQVAVIHILYKTAGSACELAGLQATRLSRRDQAHGRDDLRAGQGRAGQLAEHQAGSCSWSCQGLVEGTHDGDACSADVWLAAQTALRLLLHHGAKCPLEYVAGV